MGLKQVIRPSGFPVTLTEAKVHLREDSSDFDSHIDALIEASTQYVDGPNGFLGRALLDQTWDYYLDSFTDIQTTLLGKNYIELPLPPLIQILGIFSTSSAGVETEFDSSKYLVDASSQPARVALKTAANWPTAAEEFSSIRIRFRAGYLDQTVSPAVGAVPGPIKAAILLTLGALYDQREVQVVGTIVSKLPWAAEQLLRPYRVYLSMA